MSGIRFIIIWEDRGGGFERESFIYYNKKFGLFEKYTGDKFVKTARERGFDFREL